jgi:hypothetical protein
LFLIFPTVSATVFSFFVCRKVEENYYLVADFNVICYDSQWRSFIPYDLAMMFVYPIGIPFLFGYLLMRYKKQFYDPLTRVSFGFLYDGYAKETWWFELVDMAHKLCLTSLLPFLQADIQLQIGMCICILYAVVILLRRPYYRKGDDRLHLSAQVELFLMMLAGFVFLRGNKLDTTSDALISIFLIIVVTGFVIVFLAQTFHIFHKMFKKFMAKRVEAKELTDTDTIKLSRKGKKTLRGSKQKLTDEEQKELERDEDSPWWAARQSLCAKRASRRWASWKASWTKARLMSIRSKRLERRRRRRISSISLETMNDLRILNSQDDSRS